MHEKNEPRDDIFSQRDVLLGCCYCRRSCVLVDHENCATTTAASESSSSVVQHMQYNSDSILAVKK